jgi:hypothetical protein
MFYNLRSIKVVVSTSIHNIIRHTNPLESVVEECNNSVEDISVENSVVESVIDNSVVESVIDNSVVESVIDNSVEKDVVEKDVVIKSILKKPNNLSPQSISQSLSPSTKKRVTYAKYTMVQFYNKNM